MAQEDRRVHPDCINASNPYHECVEYCFFKIAEAKERNDKEQEVTCKIDEYNTTSGPGVKRKTDELSAEDIPIFQELTNAQDDTVDDHEQKSEKINDNDPAVDYSKLTGRQKKLFDLRLKMNEARKANQKDIIAEKKRHETVHEPRGVSKQKWIEEKKKILGKHLDANGLDITKAYMLDTQEAAEAKYKKWEKSLLHLDGMCSTRSLYTMLTRSVPKVYLMTWMNMQRSKNLILNFIGMVQVCSMERHQRFQKRILRKW